MKNHKIYLWLSCLMHRYAHKMCLCKDKKKHQHVLCVKYICFMRWRYDVTHKCVRNSPLDEYILKNHKNPTDQFDIDSVVFFACLLFLHVCQFMFWVTKTKHQLEMTSLIFYAKITNRLMIRARIFKPMLNFRI